MKNIQFFKLVIILVLSGCGGNKKTSVKRSIESKNLIITFTPSGGVASRKAALINAAVNDEQEHVSGVLLPVNGTRQEGPGLQFFVAIPDDFRPLQPTGLSTKTGFVECVKQNKSKNYWTQSIATHTLPQKSIQARQATDYIKKSIFAKQTHPAEQDVIVLEESQEHTAHYDSSKLIMVYTNNTHKELLYAYYISGPLNCAGIQYIVQIDSKTAEKDVVQMINVFMMNNTELVHF